MLGKPTRPHPWECTSRHWLPWRYSADLGSDAGGVIGRGAWTWATHRTWPARRWQPLGTSEPPTIHVTKVPLGYRLPPSWKRLEPGSSRPPAPRVLVLLVARWLAKHPRAHCSPLLPVVRNEHAAALRGFQRLPPIKGIPGTAGKWSPLIRASELAQPGKNTRVRHQCITGSGTPSVSVSRTAGTQGNSRRTTAPSPFSYTQPYQNTEDALKQLRCQQLQITPYTLRHGGASEDRAVSAKSLEEVQKRGRWKSFTSVRRYEKLARLSLVMSKCRQSFFSKDLRSNATWNDFGEGSDTSAARLVGTILSIHGCVVLFLDPSRGPAFDVGPLGSVGVACGSSRLG